MVSNGFDVMAMRVPRHKISFRPRAEFWKGRIVDRAFFEPAVRGGKSPASAPQKKNNTAGRAARPMLEWIPFRARRYTGSSRFSFVGRWSPLLGIVKTRPTTAGGCAPV